MANRARRVRHGITEDWIRQHTAGGSDLEKRHWLSDGSGSENSSLSGSFSGDEAAWLGFPENRTPRASRQNRAQDAPQARQARPRKQSSSDTLKALLNEKSETEPTMDSLSRTLSSESSGHARASPSLEMLAMERPRTPKGANGAAGTPKANPTNPLTPSRVTKRAPPNMTPRLKKKVPWKGKNILILLPRDEERGQPEKGRIPLSEAATNNLFRSWEQLGYNIEGFDLDPPVGYSAPGEQSQSRGAWPDFEELVQERKRGNWTVLLPDLNGEPLVAILFEIVLTL